MSAIPMAITAQDVAKGLSMFEIDESLEALVEAAEQDGEEAHAGEYATTPSTFMPAELNRETTRSLVQL